MVSTIPLPKHAIIIQTTTYVDFVLPRTGSGLCSVTLYETGTNNVLALLCSDTDQTLPECYLLLLYCCAWIDVPVMLSAICFSVHSVQAVVVILFESCSSRKYTGCAMLSFVFVQR